MTTTIKSWKTLTWSALESWTGSRTIERGTNYQKERRVSELVLCSDGSIIATVLGTEPYITKVSLDTKKRSDVRLSSYCSCPVGHDCKHGVAAVMQMIADCEAGKKPTTIPDTDIRFRHLQHGGAAPVAKNPSRKSKKQRITEKQIRQFLADESKENLIDRLVEHCSQNGDFRKSLADEVAIAGGHFDDLLAEAYAEMRMLTAEEAWYDPWNDEGELPDYSGLQTRMATLLASGHADELVEFGKELMTRGTNQLNRSDDEGHTSGEISSCMKVVASAIMQSSMPKEQKLLTAINSRSEDGFGIAGHISELCDRRWPKAAWSFVADELIVQLHTLPTETERHGYSNRNYKRDQIGHLAIDALRRCDRNEEAREISVAEAKNSGNFVRAVEQLMLDEFHTEAEELAYEGLLETNPTHYGTIGTLQRLIGEIAAKRKDWAVPASIAAENFFDSPSVDRHQQLMNAAKKAKCSDVVETAARKFLETGNRPDLDRNQTRRTKPTKVWPLPRAPLGQNGDQPVIASRHDAGPHYRVLIGLAIKANNPNEALHWYDSAQQNESQTRFGFLGIDGCAVADAIQDSHPDRATEIYLHKALSVAAQTNTKTYPEVGKLLRKVKTLLVKNKQQAEWKTILTNFKAKHGRKPRLMEVVTRIDRDIIAKAKR